MKIVINTCHGGYGLSPAAYAELGIDWKDGYGYKFENDRTNRRLIAVVKKLGPASFGESAELKVVEVPDGVEWRIYDHNGIESIHEKHRSWE